MFILETDSGKYLCRGHFKLTFPTYQTAKQYQNNHGIQNTKIKEIDSLQAVEKLRAEESTE